MNTPIRKLLQAQETPLSGQLHKQFLNNLDLNMPNKGERSRFPNGYEINSEVEPAPGNSKKRSFMETTGDYKSCSRLDLELKLSSLGRSSENYPRIPCLANSLLGQANPSNQMALPACTNQTALLGQARCLAKQEIRIRTTKHDFSICRIRAWRTRAIRLAWAPPARVGATPIDVSCAPSTMLGKQKNCVPNYPWISSLADSSLRIEENTKGSTNGKMPKSVLMGCRLCRTYTLASEANPKCQKCKTSILLDTLRGNPSKRSKKPQFN